MCRQYSTPIHIADTLQQEFLGMFDRITFDPKVMGGRACIRGMRITAALVLNLIANGMSTDEIIREYPDLEPDDIRQVLGYASALANEEVHLFTTPAA